MKWLVILVVFFTALFFWVRSRQNPAPEPLSPGGKVMFPPQVELDEHVPPPRDPEDKAKRLEEIADRVGVDLDVLAISPDRARLRVSWTGNVASKSGDFIDECLSKGVIRDFEQPTKQTAGFDKQGRQVWTTEFEVKF